MITLIAQWATHEGATLEPPNLVLWEDGTPATPADYKKHIDDTHAWILKSPDIIERHIFPDIVADVRYDYLVGAWVVSVHGVETATLTLKDPNATDDEIREELFTFPVIYRARIHR